MSVGRNATGQGEVALAEPPAGAELNPKAPPTGPRPDGRPRELFLAVRCSSQKRPYLVRYRYVASADAYEFAKTHLIDDDYFAGDSREGQAETMSSVRFQNVPPCPRCGSQDTLLCPCGGLLCCPTGETQRTCPRCKKTLKRGGITEIVPVRQG